MMGYSRTLGKELESLRKLNAEHILEKVASHEDEKTEIAAIFERENQARIHFEVCLAASTTAFPRLIYRSTSSIPMSGFSKQQCTWSKMPWLVTLATFHSECCHSFSAEITSR